VVDQESAPKPAGWFSHGDTAWAAQQLRGKKIKAIVD